MLFRQFLLHCLSYVDAFSRKDFWLVRLITSFVVICMLILAFPVVLLLSYKNVFAETETEIEADEWSAINANMFLSSWRQSRMNKNIQGS